MTPSGERLGQSLDALQQIALQNRGVPRRKNVLWVGRGGPLYARPAEQLSGRGKTIFTCDGQQAGRFANYSS